MKHLIQDLWTLTQRPVGPLVDHLEPFANHLLEQGYCRRYIGAQIRVAAYFSRWLQSQSVSATDVTQALAERYLQGNVHRHSGAIKRGEIATLRRLIHSFTTQRHRSTDQSLGRANADPADGSFIWRLSSR